jgi:DNA-directed RNA polymerase subunit RPC12/RpoP
MAHSLEICSQCKREYLVEEHQDEAASYVACGPCRSEMMVKRFKNKISDQLIQDTFRKYAKERDFDDRIITGE